MNEKPERKFSPRDIVGYLLVALVIFGVVFLLGRMDQSGGYSYAQVRRLFVQEQVEYFQVDESGTLNLRLRQPLPNGETAISHRLASLEMFYADLGELIQEQLDRDILHDCDFEAPFQPPSPLLVNLPSPKILSFK